MTHATKSLLLLIAPQLLGALCAYAGISAGLSGPSTTSASY